MSGPVRSYVLKPKMPRGPDEWRLAVSRFFEPVEDALGPLRLARNQPSSWCQWTRSGRTQRPTSRPPLATPLAKADRVSSTTRFVLTVQGDPRISHHGDGSRPRWCAKTPSRPRALCCRPLREECAKRSQKNKICLGDRLFFPGPRPRSARHVGRAGQ